MHSGQIIHLISRLHARTGEIIRAELERRGLAGLVPSHGSILAMLYAQGELPMSTLALGIGRRKNTVTTLVRKLEDAGYVRRKADPADNRVSMVSLTTKGETFREDFEEISGVLLDKTWGQMEGDRRKALLAGMEELLRNLG
jgi:Transcriptional regulators